MKAVIQRVSHASVTIDNRIVSKINKGVLILLGITPSDTKEDINYLCKKIINLRIFNDEHGIMNHSLLDVDGEAIVVSQFTLMANTKKGNRPSYMYAANAEIAIPLYEQFILEFESVFGKKIGSGMFGADMKVDLQNDGPVTIIFDTQHK